MLAFSDRPLDIPHDQPLCVQKLDSDLCDLRLQDLIRQALNLKAQPGKKTGLSIERDSKPRSQIVLSAAIRTPTDPLCLEQCLHWD